MSLEVGSMGRHPSRVALLATSSALALLVGLEQSAGACTVVTNPALPYTQSGDPCVHFTVSPASSGNVPSTGAVNAVGPGIPSLIGIFVDTGVSLNGSITNAGSITVGSGQGILVNQSTITGSIVNSTGALISSNGYGINVSGSSALPANATVGGSIVNNGTINSVNSGIQVQNAVAQGVTNTGSITASGPSGAAIALNQATIVGDVVNTGHLSAPSFSAALVIENGGSIGGSVRNSGTIDGVGAAIEIFPSSGISQTITGSVVNEATGKLTGNHGILLAAFFSSAQLTVHGDAVNNGTITGRTGIEVLDATVGGDVRNTGTITADRYGIRLINVTCTGQCDAGPASIGGNVVNSGSITSNGSGFAGILLNGAQLAGGIGNAAGATINAPNGAGILIDGGASVVGGVINNGTISAQTGIMVTGGSVLNGGITNSGTLSGSVAAINLTGEGAPTAINVLGGAITGNIIGAGSDTLNFTLGVSGGFTYNSNFTGIGQVNINSGVVALNGIDSATATAVNSTGILIGTGQLNSNVTINNGGAFAPGKPGVPGTSMTIGGNLAFQMNAAYVVYLNPSTTTFANVTGTASLGGAVDANFAPGSYVSKSYDILHSSGLNGTTFNALITNGLPQGFNATLSYTPTDVFLNLIAALGTGTPLNTNQQNVVNAINNFFNNGGTLPPGFVSLFTLNGANLGNALTALDGENATGAEHSAFQLMNEFVNLMLDPYVDGRFGVGGGGSLGFAPDQQASLPPDIALAYAGVLKAPPKQTFDQRWTTWAAGFGGSARTNGDPTVGSNNVTTSTFGYAAGMDYHVSPYTVLGLALAGGGTGWNLAQGLGTGRSDAFLAGIYGVTHQGPAYVAGALVFANDWFTTNRTALGDQLSARFEGQSYAARLEGGYRLVVPLGYNTIGVTPYAAIPAQNFHTPSYRETDLTAGGFGLSYAAMNGTDTRSELGARFDDPTLLGHMPLILRARAAWAHDWVSNPALNASFEALPGASFTVFGAPIPHDSALTSAGAELFFTPNWSLLAKFDGEFAKGSQTYAGTGTLRYTW